MLKEDSRNQRLAINVIINLIVVFASFGITFFLTPYLVVNIGKEAYSFYPITNNIIAYMNVFTVILNSMASRFITIALYRNEDKLAKQYYTSVFVANIALSMLLLLPMIIVVFNANIFFDIPDKMYNDVIWLLIMMFVTMIIRLISSVFGIATFTKNRMDIKAYIDLFEICFRCALFIIAFHFVTPSIIVVGVVNLISSVLSVLLQFITSRKLMPEFNIKKEWLSLKAIKELCSSGIWNAIGSLGSSLLLSISLILANSWIGATAGGNVSIAQTLPQIITTITSAISAVLVPRITTVYAEGNREELLNVTKMSQSILGLITTVPISLCVVFGVDFFRLWVPNENANYLQVLAIILMVQPYVHANMWTIYNLNVTNNTTKFPSVFLIVCGILNVTVIRMFLNFTDFGLYVIVFSSMVICSLYYGLFIPVYTAKKLGYKKFVFYPIMGRILGFMIIFCFMAFTTKSLFSIDSWFKFILYGGIYGMLGLLLYIVIVIRLRNVIPLLKPAVKYRKKTV